MLMRQSGPSMYLLSTEMGISPKMGISATETSYNTHKNENAVFKILQLEKVLLFFTQILRNTNNADTHG